VSDRTTSTLLPATSYNFSSGLSYVVDGNAYPASSYYLGNDCTQTISYSVSQLTGNLVIQGTLSNKDPLDWFDVFKLQANVDITANADLQANSNVTSYVNIPGNFVYTRARIEDFSTGTVNFVKISY
jgi:hypothetical protein